MEARQQRGMDIAATTRIVKKGDRWVVPSQSLNGKYTVTKTADAYQCTRPDHELRQIKCKHAFAVEFAMKREYHADGTETVTAGMRITYAQDWPAYNAAQTSEKTTFCRLLRDLCDGIPEVEQQRGRPRLPIGDALFSATFKVYSTVSARRFMTDLRDAEAKGLITHTPCYNSIFNVIESAEVTSTIQNLITTSSLPLRAVESTFAVDSTGFGLQRFYRHYSAKYGHDQVACDYLKVHAMIGVKTHIVTGVTITDRDRHDITQFKPLLEQTAQNFSMQEVLADKAYNSREMVAFVDKMGAKPFIPFRSNCAVKPNLKAVAWDRLFHLYNFKREEFLAHYHKRSNVESAFSSMKRKFGDFIRSKTEVAQTNEALLKVLAHNIVCVVHSIHELGIAPMLTNALPKKELTCPENPVWQ